MITDLFGAVHTVEAALHPEWGRVVYLGDRPLAPGQARFLAQQLLVSANTLASTLVGIDGGAS